MVIVIGIGSLFGPLGGQKRPAKHALRRVNVDRVESFNGKGAEEWIVYCDDNNNDVLDDGEEFVEFSTKYNYDKAEEGTTNYKGYIK